MKEWEKEIIEGVKIKKNGGRHFLISRCRRWFIDEDEEETWSLEMRHGIFDDSFIEVKNAYEQAWEDYEDDLLLVKWDFKDDVYDSWIMISCYDEATDEWRHGIHIPGINDRDFERFDIDKIRRIVYSVAKKYDVAEIRLDNYREVNSSNRLCPYKFFGVLRPSMHENGGSWEVECFKYDLQEAMSYIALVYIGWTDMYGNQDADMDYIVVYKQS